MAAAVLGNIVLADARVQVKPYSQEAHDQYNVLRFLGTASPYVSGTGYGISREVPDNCNITQVNVIARHGERYPTASAGKEMSKTLERIRNITDELVGDLSFLPSYSFDALNPEQYDNLTSLGPYSGLAEAFKFGVEFRSTYNELFGDEEDIRIFSASQERVVESARKFTAGFFSEFQTPQNFTIIDEDDDTLGANSLTPVTSCLSFDKTANEELYGEFNMHRSEVADRLNELTPGLNITEDEVGALIQYCGFDLDVSGKSKICEIFTSSELYRYSYGEDLEYYYTKGPGHNLTKYIGEAYVSGVIELFKSHPEVPISVGFAHDSDLFYIYSALGLFDNYNPSNETQPLPIDFIDFNANWRVSNIAPMAGRLVVEKLECQVDDKADDFVRILVNDAVIPIPQKGSGPGYSTSLEDLEDYINDKLQGSYSDYCELKDDSVPKTQTFWWE